MAKIPSSVGPILNSLLRTLSFDENFKCSVQTIELTNGVENKLANPFPDNIIPRHYLVTNKDIPGEVYNGSTEWTTSNLYLRTTAASTQTITIIIMA